MPAAPSEASPVPASLARASDPVLLALDTATERLHLALSTGQGEVARVSALDLPGGAQASAQLLPGLLQLLGQAGLTWADVSAIAFGAGPGAFTGLRTACSVTQGLAMGLNVPVILVDTLMAVAEDARQQAAPDELTDGDVLWVLQDARMGELYVAAFTWSASTGWREHVAAALWPLDEPRRRWSDAAAGTGQAMSAADSAGVRVCGNAWHACAPAFEGLSRVRPLHPQAAPTGRALATLARRAWSRGECVDPALALPCYVRDKVAQTTAERQAPSGMMPA
ncbi:MAG: tRNA (adenosine(37)-N6)-threonylcarbamoyltransferase complex dimerization subunit type 1 TsaB [Burkholderiales bacterium]|nr:tRNA (adenosine(37)-N6)-threonylcarbamoyltransferase complex dimerization subunit type 1 TsaB [Burkholderiales bacterium]